MNQNYQVDKAGLYTLNVAPASSCKNILSTWLLLPRA